MFCLFCRTSYLVTADAQSETKRNCMIIVICNDTLGDSSVKDEETTIEIEFDHPQYKNHSWDARGALYIMDTENGNPYKKWQKIGRPAFPTRLERRHIRDNEVGT